MAEENLGECPESMNQETSHGQHSNSENRLNIILVGKSGVGKSATGNSILKKAIFPSKLSPQPVTEAIQESSRKWQKWTLVVIDTPPVLKKEDVTNKWGKELCIVIMVIQLGRYTKEDRNVYKHVKKIFKKPRKKMVLLFTRKEDLGGGSLSEYLNESDNKHLKKLIKKHKIPYCAFNNKTDEEKEKECQINDLMTNIMKLKCFREYQRT